MLRKEQRESLRGNKAANWEKGKTREESVLSKIFSGSERYCQELFCLP